MEKLINKRISGYKIVCNFNNERVLAYNRNAPQQWVVWRVDNRGGTYWGKYFTDASEAKLCFIQSVIDTRTTPQEFYIINNIRTETLVGILTLKHNGDTYDIVSNFSYDFCETPLPAWNAYIRELKTLVTKQIFEIFNLEKMNAEA